MVKLLLHVKSRHEAIILLSIYARVNNATVTNYTQFSVVKFVIKRRISHEDNAEKDNYLPGICLLGVGRSVCVEKRSNTMPIINLALVNSSDFI